MIREDLSSAAREWAAANPDAPGSVHVRAALDEAERYRILAEEAMGDQGRGTRVVIACLGSDYRIAITTKSHLEDVRIAEAACRFSQLVLATAQTAAKRTPKK